MFTILLLAIAGMKLLVGLWALLRLRGYTGEDFQTGISGRLARARPKTARHVGLRRALRSQHGVEGRADRPIPPAV